MAEKDDGPDWVEEKQTTIEEFPNYQISTLGRVFNTITKKYKQISLGQRGYPVLSLRKDGKTYIRTIHILLGRAFIKNDDAEHKTQINHIDGDKTNYSLDNLEQVTPKENILHARKTGLHISDGDKAVIQYSLDGEFIAEYKSASEASRQTGIGRANICNVCRKALNQHGNPYKTAGGYKQEWKKNII